MIEKKGFNLSMSIMISATLIVFFFSSFSVQATNLNEGAFFARCYAALTGEHASSTHPLLIDSIVKNNHSNTINNCMKIYDKARLVPNRYPAVKPGYPVSNTLVNENDPESLKVFNYLFSVFTSYFEVKTFGHKPQTYSGNISEQWDRSEDALYFMRAIFEGSSVSSSGAYVNQFDFDKVLTDDQSLTGKRIFATKNNHAVNTCRSYGSNCDYSPTYVERSLMDNFPNWLSIPTWDWQGSRGSSPGSGALTGIKVWPKGNSTLRAANGQGYNFPKMPRSHGAGAIGSTSYILKNAQYSGSTNGAVFNRRRIIKNAFSSFLCRDQPPLPMDHPSVLNRVSEYAAANFDKQYSVAFRESVLCASCHVTYDEAAAVYKNTYIQSGGSNLDWNADGFTPGNYLNNYDKFGYDRMTLVESYTLASLKTMPEHHLINGVSNSPSTLQKANNIIRKNDFITSKPNGRLIFTDYKGNDVDVDLPASASTSNPNNAGIQELGNAMASTDQYYVCTVNRMFKHLSGIYIHLENPNDPRMAKRSKAENYYLDNIIEPLAIGANGLSNHKSFRRMFKELISQEFYRRADLRGVK